jgi:hypothetical protein
LFVHPAFFILQPAIQVIHHQGNQGFVELPFLFATLPEWPNEGKGVLFTIGK